MKAIDYSNGEQDRMSQARDVRGTDPSALSLYRVGGAAALLCALMYLITMAIYIPAYREGAPPSTVVEWFTLLQSNPLTGLFFLGLADVIIVVLWGPMSLALYAALSPINRTWTRIAIPFVFVGMGVYLATNAAFTMLALSQQYAAATSPADKALFLGSGQTILAFGQGTGGQYAGMPLVWLAGLIFSVVMRKSQAFGNLTAWLGIVSLGFLLGTVPFSGYTFGPPAGSALATAVVAVAMLGGLLSLAWYILVGRSLWRLWILGYAS